MRHRKLEAIYKDISKLTGNEKKILLSRLVAEMKVQPEKKVKNSITDIRGMGKEIWDETDAQEYVNSERSSWE
jgi:hypothetical protein